jgi:dihydroanticapsin dehydrogenase
VLCVDITDGVFETARIIEEASGTAKAVRADVSESSAVDAYTQLCYDHFGSVDVVVNNAGVNIPGIFHDVSNEVVERTFDVNLKGPLFGCRAAIPYMLGQGSGSIVNVASVNGLVSEPYLTVYAASKGGVVMLTKGVALDYATKGIRCNCICPGWVDTPINYAHAEMLGGLQHVYDTIQSFQPMGRPGRPEEIASVVSFLAGSDSSFLTGSIIAADGGMTAQ